jgi:hypothetical protein
LDEAAMQPEEPAVWLEEPTVPSKESEVWLELLSGEIKQATANMLE